MRTIHRHSLVFASVLLALGCATTPSSTDVVVAAEGGTVEAPGSFAITIPANALAADTEIGLAAEPVSAYPELPGANDEVVVLTPEGTVLETPASVTIDSSVVGASVDQRVSVFQLDEVDGVQSWRPMESEFRSNGTVAVSVTRFSPLGIVVADADATGAIRGTLHWGGSGDPVEGAPMQLWGNDVMVGEATTDATGAFSFTDVEPGTYAIQTNFECSLTETVEVTAGQTAEPSLTLCGS